MKSKRESGLEGITKEIKSIREQAEYTLPVYRKDVDKIIDTQVKSASEIENILDCLLDLCLIGVGDEEFKRLNSYYMSVDSEKAKSYDQFYKSMFD
ncbi:MAG: hypothetical protein NTV63_01360 [Candidatus Woesearchaeota archaeon]|nr:hypothetical protein [Candidatus Woesearchaeota archaeon]